MEDSIIGKVVGAIVLIAALIIGGKFFINTEDFVEDFMSSDKPVSEFSYIYEDSATVSGELKEYIKLRNKSLCAQCGGEICFAVFNNLNGKSIEKKADELEKNWLIGDKDKKNGVLAIIVKDSGQYLIRSGEGLAHCLSFEVLSGIEKSAFANAIPGGDYESAIRVALDELVEYYEAAYSIEVVGD